jgi:hypothetical protein
MRESAGLEECAEGQETVPTPQEVVSLFDCTTTGGRDCSGSYPAWTLWQSSSHPLALKTGGRPQAWIC